METVPGCTGSGIYQWDYCVDRPEAYLFYTGDNLGSEQYGLCEGDCDSDDDCQGSLVCFQRDEYTPVPGCDGEGGYDKDYCSFTSSPPHGITDQGPNIIAVRCSNGVSCSEFITFIYPIFCSIDSAELDAIFGANLSALCNAFNISAKREDCN